MERHSDLSDTWEIKFSCTRTKEGVSESEFPIGCTPYNYVVMELYGSRLEKQAKLVKNYQRSN